MYRRNRYYDPATGQFTQEDPLGLAGGMNAYGFGNGDPITFSDPFGLTCYERGNCTQSERLSPPTDGIEHDELGTDLAAATATAIVMSGRGLFSLAKALISKGGDNAAEEPAASGPRRSPKFKTPSNAPQLPPKNIPAGWRVRSMPPTEQYPDGYWRLEKPMENGGWQGIDPSTMKPGSQWETHVPYPPASQL
jgi:hypothetical protein